MKAMIFAAGLGTRLLPLTENRPKALVEVAGVPALQRVIMNLVRYGFDEVVMSDAGLRYIRNLPSDR